MGLFDNSPTFANGGGKTAVATPKPQAKSSGGLFANAPTFANKSNISTTVQPNTFQYKNTITNGFGTPKTATKPKPTYPILTAPTKTYAPKVVIPSWATPYKLPNGNTAYKTPSGTVTEILADGNHVNHIAGNNAVPQTTNITDPNDKNKILNAVVDNKAVYLPSKEAHDDYGGQNPLKGFQRDDLTPVGLGGLNSDKGNIRLEYLLPGGKTGTYTDPLEKQLINQVKGGKITLAQARQQIMSTKFNQDNPVPQGVLNNLGAGIKNILPNANKTIEELANDPLNLNPKADPQKVANAMWNAIKGPIKEEAGRIGDLFNPANATDPARKLNSNIQALTGAANVAFSPITALFEGANQLPVLGSVSKLLSAGFQAAGDAGVATSNALIDKLPISQEAKDKLKPGLAEISALASQIVIGGGITDGAMENLKAKYGETDAHTIVEKAKEVASQAPKVESNTVTELPTSLQPKTLEQAHQEAMNNGNVLSASKITPNIAPDTTPITLQQARENAFSHPVTEEPKIIPQEAIMPTTPEPLVKETPTVEIKTTETPKISTTPEVSSAEKAPSKIGKSIEAKAVEQELSKSVGDSATYTKKNIEEQSAKIADIMNTDLEKAKNMALGKEPIPSDISPVLLSKAIEDHAFKTGDVSLIRDLANSPLTSETSVHAQEMRLMQERNPESAVTAIKDLMKARKEKALRDNADLAKTTKKIAKDIKKEISKTHTKETWSSFVESLKC